MENKDTIINVTEYMRENLQRIEPDIDSNEKEVLAYISMAMYKMFLIGETSHKWSESFKKMIKDIPKGFLEFIR